MTNDQEHRFFRFALAQLPGWPLLAPAFAQDFPERAIEYIIPFNPGGESDITARGLQEPDDGRGPLGRFR